MHRSMTLIDSASRRSTSTIAARSKSICRFIYSSVPSGLWRIIEHQRTIGRHAHFQPDFGDDVRVRLVADIDDVRITPRGRPTGTCGRETAGRLTASGLPAGTATHAH